MRTQTRASTRVWKQLNKSKHAAAANVVSALRPHLRDAEEVLAKAQMALGDFTIHDGRHALRVAERIVEIIPADVLPQRTLRCRNR